MTNPTLHASTRNLREIVELSVKKANVLWKKTNDAIEQTIQCISYLTETPKET